MPPLMYHVFKAGQQCVRARAGVGGESTERLPRHSNVDANLTHARVLPTVCVAISSSLTDLRGVLPFPFPHVPSFAKSGVGACLRPSSPSVAKSFQVALLNGVLAAGHCSRMPVSANSV